MQKAQNPDLIPAYMDFCFKQIFSDKEILLNFLSATLLNWPFAPITDLEFLDRELTKDALYDKESRLDLKVKTQEAIKSALSTTGRKSMKVSLQAQPPILN